MNKVKIVKGENWIFLNNKDTGYVFCGVEDEFPSGLILDLAWALKEELKNDRRFSEDEKEAILDEVEKHASMIIEMAS